MKESPRGCSFLLIFATAVICSAPRGFGCGLSCTKDCRPKYCAAECCRFAQKTKLRWPFDSTSTTRGMNVARTSIFDKKKRNNSIYVAKQHATRKKVQKKFLTHFGHLRRLPPAMHGRRVYHEGMYTTRNISKVLHMLKPEKGLKPECVFNAFEPEKLLQYAIRVSDDLVAQLRAQGLRRGTSDVCLFSSLSDDANGQYIIGHQTFMDSLLHFHPDLTKPMILMELDNNGSMRTGLSEKTRLALRKQYAPTVFVRPFVCPDVPYQWPTILLPSGKKVRNSFSMKLTTHFYRRLQAFTLTPCKSIVAFDTSDMVVTKPIHHVLSPMRIMNGSDFVAASRCDSRHSKGGVSQYFNAGLYIIGQKHLTPQTYASLVSIIISPLQPSIFEPHRWAADQDVLNAYFNPERGGQDMAIIGHEDNYAKHFADSRKPWLKHCVPPHRARIIHFLGSKPWVAWKKRRHYDRSPHIMDVERYWFAAYYKKKTIVIGGGPSVKPPAGLYIDMFERVVRVNDYKITDAQTTGLRTTDVVLHSTTRRGNFSSLSASHILLAGFGAKMSTINATMLSPNHAGLNVNRVTVLPSRYYTELKQKMALATGMPYLESVIQARKKFHPLTGTIALEWALHTTRERPVFYLGFDLMSGGKYTHGMQQYSTSVDTRSLRLWHRVKYDRAFLNTRENIDKSLRRLDVPIP